MYDVTLILPKDMTFLKQKYCEVLVEITNELLNEDEKEELIKRLTDNK